MFPSFSYVTDHTGFCGTIKNSPSDFIVTEIEVPQHLLRDTRAESLQKASEEPLEQSTPGPQQPNELSGESPGLCAESCPGAVPRPSEQDTSRVGGDCLASPNKKQREGEPELKQDLGEGHILDSLLGKSMSEQLHQFVCGLKDTWDLGRDAGGGAEEFSLGPVLDKKSRASLHSAVRQKFPFLVTVTKGNEMIVKGNGDYKELCQLVTEKETSDFFKFLDAKLENSTFSFEPDGDKEHRKVVHHFINRKFGKLLETKSFTASDVNDQRSMSIMVRFREKGWSRKRSAGGFKGNQDLYTGKCYIFSEKCQVLWCSLVQTETQSLLCDI